MPESRPTLLAIFARFLRFGLLAWGGPVAQIAMIKRELVEEEQWLTPERFNRLLAIYQVLPGPGGARALRPFRHDEARTARRDPRRAGLHASGPGADPGHCLGLWAAGPRPAADRGGVPRRPDRRHRPDRPRGAPHRRACADRRWLWAVGRGERHRLLDGRIFWIILPVAGVFYASAAAGRTALAAATAGLGLALADLDGRATGIRRRRPRPAWPQAASVGAAALFLSGLKAGLLTFGGAYTAIPFVRNDAVGQGWVNEGQFLDSLALSGIIPAPLIIFATFVGYLAGGLPGALAITAGIFLPAFSFRAAVLRPAGAGDRGSSACTGCSKASRPAWSG